MEQSARDLCSDSERVYCENYVISLNKSKAAKAMGSDSVTPEIIGWQVYQRPHVKAYITELLDQATIDAKETLKLISDTSKGNMSDYMFPVQKLKIPQVRKGLQEMINQLQYEIEIDAEFLQLAVNLTKEEITSVQSKIRSAELDITRFDIELNKNPSAYRIVDGDPYLSNEIELDLHAVIADKEHARIKSYKVTKEGVQIELCDPDTSKDRMARVHGLYDADNKIKIITEQPLFDGDSQ